MADISKLVEAILSSDDERNKIIVILKGIDVEKVGENNKKLADFKTIVRNKIKKDGVENLSVSQCMTLIKSIENTKEKSGIFDGIASNKEKGKGNIERVAYALYILATEVKKKDYLLTDKSTNLFDKNSESNDYIYAENERLTKENEELSEAYKNLFDKNKKLKKAYKKLSDENKKLQETLNKFSEDDEKLSEAYKNLFDKNKKLQETYKNLSDENKKLQEAYKNPFDENKKLQEAYKNLSDENKKLQEAYKNLSDENKKLQEDHKNLFDENKNAHMIIEKLGGKNDKLRSKIKELNSEIGAINKKIAEVKASEDNKNIAEVKVSENNTYTSNKNSYIFQNEIDKINSIINGKDVPHSALFKEVSVLCRLGSDFVSIENDPPYFCYLSTKGNSSRLYLYPSKLGIVSIEYIKPLFDVEYSDDFDTAVLSPTVLSAKGTGYSIVEKGKINICKSIL